MKEYKYTRVWNVMDDFETVEALALRLTEAAKELKQMKEDGLVVHGICDNLVRVMTDDPEIAKKYEMITTEEFNKEDKEDNDEDAPAKD